MKRRGNIVLSVLLGVLAASMLGLTTDQIIKNVYDSANTALRINVVAGSAGGGVTSTGTSPNLAAFTSATNIGNYAGDACASPTDAVNGISAAGVVSCITPAGSGTVTGTGSANQVSYWTGASAIGGDAGMTYAAATDTLTSGNVIVGPGSLAAPSLKMLTPVGSLPVGFYAPNNNGQFLTAVAAGGATVNFYSNATGANLGGVDIFSPNESAFLEIMASNANTNTNFGNLSSAVLFNLYGGTEMAFVAPNPSSHIRFATGGQALTNERARITDTGLAVGFVGGASGNIDLLGTTSGVISLKAQAAAGTYNFNLPTTAGTAGQVLTSQGGVGSAMTWTTPSAGTPSYPVTVSGTVNSGGIPYFSSTTVESSSAALTAGAVVVGGGAGAAPFSGNCTNATGTLPMSCPAASGSEVFGSGASAGASPGANNTIVGNGATITTARTGNTVIGQAANTGSSNDDSVAIGRAAFGGSAGAGLNVVVGASSSITAGAGRSVAIGQLAVAGGNDDVIIGRNASCTTSASIVLGSSATCTVGNQFVAGSSTPINNVYFGKGVVSTTATDYTINGTGGSGSDNVGGAVIIASGRSTGAAIPPDVPIQTSVPTTSGSTAQTLGDRLRVLGKYTTLTEATATAFARVAIATGTVAGGQVVVSVQANDATDFQSRVLRAGWSAVNKAGTITAALDTPDESVAVSAGTLTCTLTLVDATGGNLDMKADCTSSLTQTTLRANAYVTKNFGVGAISAL